MTLLASIITLLGMIFVGVLLALAFVAGPSQPGRHKLGADDGEEA